MLRKRIILLTLSALMLLIPIVMPANAFAAETEGIQSEEEMSFEIKDTRDLNVLKGELKNFIEENPNSTEEEQDAHLINFINNAGLERPKARSIGDYMPGYGSLNTKERELAKAHHYKRLTFLMQQLLQHQKPIEVYGSNGFQDNSDAFRHCLWNALMKKSLGTADAKKWQQPMSMMLVE